LHVFIEIAVAQAFQGRDKTDYSAALQTIPRNQSK
jgi:hypothetical protein